MALEIIQVDAFTDTPFRGNPAAVCVLDEPAAASWMQNVAAEMNLSETAFLYPAGHRWELRWFTPACEVDLCGHATLASAHVLYETERLGLRDVARFETRSGELQAWRDGPMLVLDFPSQPPAALDAPIDLIEALRVAPEWVGRNQADFLVELADEELVRTMAPDMNRLRAVDARGVIVTARAADGAGHDFVSRFFAPRVGVDEDPVTGSAHTALGPYWAARLERTDLTGYQASRRGGIVGVRVRDDDRIELRGHAVSVLRAQLLDSAAEQEES